MSEFNPSRARLSKKDSFQRFRVTSSKSLAEVVKKGKVDLKDELLIVERSGHYLAFSVYQMAYHHVAQGELAGEPYLVNF